MGLWRRLISFSGSRLCGFPHGAGDCSLLTSDLMHFYLHPTAHIHSCTYTHTETAASAAPINNSSNGRSLQREDKRETGSISEAVTMSIASTEYQNNGILMLKWKSKQKHLRVKGLYQWFYMFYLSHTLHYFITAGRFSNHAATFKTVEGFISLLSTHFSFHMASITLLLLRNPVETFQIILRLKHITEKYCRNWITRRRRVWYLILHWNERKSMAAWNKNHTLNI